MAESHPEAQSNPKTSRAGEAVDTLWDVMTQCSAASIPTYDFSATYLLSNGLHPEDVKLSMDLQISTKKSSFSYDGYVFLMKDLPTATKDGVVNTVPSMFEIHGVGVVSKSHYTSSFQIREGTGKGVYCGISGGGRMIVTMKKGGVGAGVCAFVDMNDVGASLM